MTITDKLQSIKDLFPRIKVKGVELGKKENYREFWTKFQNGGDRTNYFYAFAGRCWNNETFKPLYPIFPVDNKASDRSAFGIFMYVAWQEENPLDFKDYNFDFSYVLDATYLFRNANARNITCDLSRARNLTQAFNCADGGNLDNIKIKVTSACTNFDRTFGHCANLTSLEFISGSELCESIDLSASKNLTAKSIESTVNALSPTASGKTLTLSYDAVTNADWSQTEAGGFANLATGHPNWEFALV